MDTTAQKPDRKKNAIRAIENSTYKLEQFSLIWADAVKLGIQLSEREEKRVKAAKAFENLKTKIDKLIPLVNKTVALQEEKGTEAARLFFTNEVEPLVR